MLVPALRRRYCVYSFCRYPSLIVLVLTALLAFNVRADPAQDALNAGQDVRDQQARKPLNERTCGRPLIIEGTVRSKGFVGKFLIATDPLKRAATIQIADAGPANFGFGVSDSRVWTKDANGVVSEADFEGFRKGIVSDAYWLSGGIANTCWPADISLVRTEQIRGVTTDVLDVLPQGGKPTRVWVSRVTHLPLRWTRRDEPDTASTTYSDYRHVGSRVIPFKQSLVDRDGNQWDLSNIRVNTNVTSAMVAEKAKTPDATLSDYWIDQGDTTTVPMAATGQSRIDVFINGKGPFSFLLDTGGTLTMTRAAAEAAGLNLSGAGHDTGIAGFAIATQFSRIEDLRLGAAHLRNQYVAVSDSAAGGADPKNAGVIGYEVLSRFTTTFDFPKRTVSLSVAPYKATPDDPPASPMTLDHSIPVVSGTMGGVADFFWIDTGFNGALIVNRTFSVAHPAAVPKRLFDTGGSLNGAGGGGSVKLGRIPTVTIGGTTFSDAIGIFSSFDKGPNTDSEFAADVGDALLGSCVVTFDYKARRVRIKQLDLQARPDVAPYNRSGFDIAIADGNVAIVSRVAKDSPADETGLHVGDHVIEINGKEISAPLVLAARATLFTRSNALTRLTVLRRGAVLDLTIQPRDYIQ